LRSPDFGCMRFCAHLTGVVKSNSSGIEVWSGSLVQAGSRWFKPAQDQEVLDRGAVDSWNPPQRGFGVTGKSSTPRINLCVKLGYLSCSL
jgi:hypothetical protein